MKLIFFCSQGETVQTVPEESRGQGTIGTKLYLKYLQAGANVAVLLFVILVNLLAQVQNQNFNPLKSHSDHLLNFFLEAFPVIFSF